MSLKSVLKLAYGLVAVILLIGGIASWSVNTLSNSASELQVLSAKKQASANLILSLTRVVMPGNDYLITGSINERTLHTQLDEEVHKTLVEMKKFMKSAEETSLLAKVTDEYEELKTIELQILSIENPIGNQQGAKLMEEMDGIADKVGDDLAELETLIRNEEVQTITYVTDSEATVTTLVSVATLIALIAVIIVCIAIRRTVINTIQPLKILIEKVRLIAGGDLTVQVTTQATGEINELVTEFNHMVHKLKDLILTVTTTAQDVALTSESLAMNTEMVSKATEEVTKAICEVAKGSSQQAEYVNSTISHMTLVNDAVTLVSRGNRAQEGEITLTSDVVKQVTQSMHHVATSSQTVAASAEKTKVAAQKGGEAVTLAISGMEQIRQDVLSTAEQIAELRKHSEEIGEIVQVIDDISEQTNLLSLNAAIEASRAGEHGKGFAVVAEEVRKLAHKSSNSTKEITTLVKSIQAMTNNVVVAMDNSTQEAERGADLAQHAGVALKEIISSVDETYDQVKSISNISDQITDNSKQLISTVTKLHSITSENSTNANEIDRAKSLITDDIEHIASLIESSSAVAQQVSAATEETLASVQEISSSAETLAVTAGSLKDKVSLFKM